MVNEQKKKGNDGETSQLLIAAGIFTAALLIIDFTWANWAGMRGWWLIGAIVGHAACVICWAFAIVSLKNPNLEFTRKLLFFFVISTLLIICFHKTIDNDGKMFQEEVDKNKKEQHAS